jgi:hypothetical protein
MQLAADRLCTALQLQGQTSPGTGEKALLIGYWGISFFGVQIKIFGHI